MLRITYIRTNEEHLDYLKTEISESHLAFGKELPEALEVQKMAPRKSPPTQRLAPRAMVLAKMPRYPQWPAFIMPKSLIPAAVLRAKRKLTPHCVIFIPDGDFYWMSEKTLDILTSDRLNGLLAKVPAEFKRKPPRKKRSDDAEQDKRRGRPSNINEAIVAAGGLKFEDFIQRILNINGSATIEEEEEDEEEIENEDQEEEEEDEEGDDDDMVDENEDNEVNDGGTGQHDMEVDTSIENDQGQSLSENDARTPSEDGDVSSADTRKMSDTHAENETRIPQLRKTRGLASRTSISLPLRAKRSRTNRAKPVEACSPISEEEKEHQLWLCRIKLQRSLIQRNLPTAPEDATKVEPPSADELSLARLILYRLLDFPILAESLRKTKIHKVLKCILRDPLLEYADSFKLHERCSELLLKWEPIILKIRGPPSSNSTGDGSDDLSAVREDATDPTSSLKSERVTKNTPDQTTPKSEFEVAREQVATAPDDPVLSAANYEQKDGSGWSAKIGKGDKQNRNQVEERLMASMDHLQSSDVKHDKSAATTVM